VGIVVFRSVEITFRRDHPLRISKPDSASFFIFIQARSASE
jgi:hypothetical protein